MANVSPARRPELRRDELEARRRDFAERVFRHTLDNLIFGDARSRTFYLARAVTWPLRKLSRTARNRKSSRPEGVLDGTRLPGDRASIAVVTGGGLGDVLSTSKFVERLYSAAGRPVIDVFYGCESRSRFVFARSPYVARLFPASALGDLRQNYDAIVDVHRLVKYHLLDYDRVSRLCPELLWLRDTSDRRNGEYSIHQREMPLLDGDLAKRAVLRGLNRKSLLGYSGAVEIGSDDWIFFALSPDAVRIFDRVGVRPGHYVTLHDGFDTAHRFSSRSTKQWPADHWRHFVAKLRAAHPELKIVQIGGSNSMPYEGVDVDLVGKASFDEVAWLVKYAVCHVDSESGLVRLTREVGGKSIVVFGPTDPEFFGFAENENLKPTKCGNCFWSTADWLEACPKGLAEPECAASITPEDVLAALETVIDQRKHDKPRFATARYYQHNGHETSTRTGIKKSNSYESRDVSASHSVASVDDESQVRDGFIAALLQNLIGRRRPIKVALIADEKSGEKIKEQLAILSGIDIIWFQLRNAREHSSGEESTLAASLGEIRNAGVRSAAGPLEPCDDVKNGIVLRYGSALTVPAGAKAFDLIILAPDLSNKLHIGFTLREMLRILKPEGVIVWTFDAEGESSRQASASCMLNPEHVKSLLNEMDIVLRHPIVGPANGVAQAVLAIELAPSV